MQNYFNDTKDTLDITENIIKNDILACQTYLIEHQNFFNLDNYSVYEVAENLFKECEECNGNGCDCCNDGEVTQEPLEWWLVTEWLHDQLNGLGFVTLDTEWGYYWGRTTSGQAIELDNVIQDVARSINKEQRQAS